MPFNLPPLPTSSSAQKMMSVAVPPSTSPDLKVRRPSNSDLRRTR
ncbi:unnamed protein product [Brassica oleracea]